MPSEETAAAPSLSNDAALDWMRQYQTQKRRCSEENGVLRNVVKRAKADGVDIKAMVATTVLAKLDPAEAVRHVSEQIRYMSLRHMPVTRETLFDHWDDRTTEKTERAEDIWDVEEKGYRAGRTGEKADDCPYQPGTEFHVAWTKFWHQGQAAIAREMGPDAKIASISKGRPAGRQTRMPGTERKMKAPPSPAAARGRKIGAKAGTKRKGNGAEHSPAA